MRLPNQALATHSGLRALCRPGDRQHRRRHRGRRAESERHSDLRGDAVGAALRVDDPFFGSVGWQRRYGNQEMSQFRSAEMIAIGGDRAGSIGRSSPSPPARRRSPRSRPAALTGGDRSRGRRDPQGGTPGSKLGQDPLAASLVEGGRLPAALPSQTSDASAALSSSTSGD